MFSFREDYKKLLCMNAPREMLVLRKNYKKKKVGYIQVAVFFF